LIEDNVMRPRYHPSVERLESMTLLSGFVPYPGGSSSSALSVSLTTDQPVYTVGQPVHMTLTETNTSNQDVHLADGPSTDGFYITQNGTTIWESNAGIQPFVSNAGIQPMFVRLVILHPGQSFTRSATWDGHPVDAMGNEQTGVSPTGTFEVLSEANASVPPATIVVQPVTVPAAHPLVVKVATNRSTYTPGQPMLITITETNAGTTPVSVLTGARILNGSVTGPDGTVWVYRDLRMIATGRGVLRPGQTRAFTMLWNGLNDVAGGKIAPGTYMVRAGVDGLTSTVAVHIGS
jgi:hypothetical protein